MPEVEVDEFEEILALENLDLYEWLSAQSAAPSELVESNSVFRKLLEYTGSSSS
ncbi:hypothetical protein Pmar_PMAR008315 [Perkinsus marinus ATCC 50983]|uniref:FAD assembly factor SdhE n=1 Tax=Perkinsus marinus (strain ATCC 50983 / TXsc) TaxID=423536 RepID=C5L8D0_PERM5|nr:hypothetical protein Pmar_PMAR008315 [Perkinsus marinus ATCC 50983]EER07013.1 hypothetical protein Pmar_PMAR008315 [Perkinsus marinus ATCC 50983]|eukprot:XP_002775197.1 hypothetical protein Pmar_PMAR008315 [Perkinsus marinus ATCC 50983]